MPDRSPARLAVQKRLRVFDSGLRRNFDSDADALHRARVATRRLREALPIVAAAEPSQPLSDVKRLIQDATRALGAVREMDVALTRADALATERPELVPAFAMIRSALGVERLARLERMRRQLDARQLRRASRELARRAGQLTDNVHPSALLADRLSDRAEDLRRAVTEAGLLYAPERLHRVRLATKKLRYALELADDMAVASTKRAVAELRSMQERLGSLHDLELLAQHARQALGQPDTPHSIAQLAEPTLSLLDERIRAQHADYLAHRDHLQRVIDRANVVSKRVRTHSPAPSVTATAWR